MSKNTPAILTTPGDGQLIESRHNPSLAVYAGKSTGWNRSSISSVSAETDSEILTLWINERGSRSKFTKDNYIRESNRLMYWLIECKKKDLRSITREDLGEYKEFIKNPPAELVGPKMPIDSSDWKPFFSDKPKNTSVRLSFGIVCAIFSWLEVVGYIAVNPASKLPRDVIKNNLVGRRRAVPGDIMMSVLLFVEDMPRNDDMQIRIYWRSRWMFNLFRLTGMRISEVQSASIGDVFSESRGGKLRTFIRVSGKGAKERTIPFIDELETEFNLYKKSRGIVSNSDSAALPLICGVSRRNWQKRLTRQAIHNALKLLFEQTVASLRESDQDSEACFLEQVSAHWLRHTYASNLLDSGASLRTGRDNLGHSNIAITSIYSHIDLDARHDETELLSGKYS